MDPVVGERTGDFRYRGWIVRVRLVPHVAWECLVWESLSGEWASLGGFETSGRALEFSEEFIDKRAGEEANVVLIAAWGMGGTYGRG
jgi:hypothetical protein